MKYIILGAGPAGLTFANKLKQAGITGMVGSCFYKTLVERGEEVSNVVTKLMDDKDYYNKISSNAINTVKEFTWDKLYSERMLNLFKDLKRK